MAALIATVMFVTDIIVLVAGGAAPSTAEGWFALLQNHRAAALFQLFFTDLVGVVLMTPIILALYRALKRANAAYSALAGALAITGIALVFVTNSNYTLIYLSDQYAAATSQIQQAQLLAAAEQMLTAGTWGTGPLMAGFFLEAALVIVSAIMLRGDIFDKRIGYLGIVAHGLDLAHRLCS